MSKTYQGEAMASIQKTMEVLHKVGAIDKQTMRRFGEACPTPVRPLMAEQIKAIRGTGACESDGVCHLSQRNGGSGEQVGRGVRSGLPVRR